jgi:hypothetical protein
MSLKNFFSGFGEGFKEFGENVALIVNSLLLSVVYIIGVGLTSLVSKLFKKSFLDMKQSKKSKTYWSNLNLKKRPDEEYYRQF